MSNGQLLFTPKNIEILGGEVEALVSKWDVTRSLALMKGMRIYETFKIIHIHNYDMNLNLRCEIDYYGRSTSIYSIRTENRSEQRCSERSRLQESRIGQAERK